MEVILLKPGGYCGGVKNAITSALNIRKETDKKIYVFGLLVHNESVKELLEKNNIETIDTSFMDKEKRLEEFKENEIVLFTAHGHDKKYEDILHNHNVTFYDLTCPYVKMNMEMIKKRALKGEVIYIGKKGHPETEAALSCAENVFLYDIKEGMDYSSVRSSSPAIINQTTLSLLEIEDIYKDIKNHLPYAETENEICQATRRRQENILSLDDDFDLFVVIGSEKSSNTDKLFQIAKGRFKDKKVIKTNSVDELKKEDFSHMKKAYLATGTSTPPEIIEEISAFLKGV